MAVSAGVVKLLLVSPAMAVPPVATSYQRYCPLVPPEAVSVAAPVPHDELPVVVGAVIELIVATTGVLALSHVPLLMDTK